MSDVAFIAENVVHLANGEMDNPIMTGFCALSTNFATI